MNKRRKRQFSLSRLIERTGQPVYLLDAERQLVSCNEALAEWLGFPVDQLIGRRCDFHSSPQVGGLENALAGLSPPPSLMGRSGQFEVRTPGRGGEVRMRSAIATRIDDGKRRPLMFVVVDPDSESVSGAGADRSESLQLHAKLAELRSTLPSRFQMEQLLGESPWMNRVREQVKIAVETRARIVIAGPQGSGREHLAKTIHYADAPELAGPLVPLDCELLDGEVLQAAVIDVKKWLQELPNQETGWFLLLEVQELTESAQHELLGLLELPRFELPTLATSNRPLEKLVSEKGFSADLATRLSTLTIELPALTDRTGDIPMLAQAFLEDGNITGGKQLEGFTPEAMDQLVNYPWPGNLDELALMIEESRQRASGPWIDADDLPAKIGYAASAERFAPLPQEAIELDEFLADIERRLIDRAIQEAGGNKTRAAELLGITRARLHRRMETESSDDS